MNLLTNEKKDLYENAKICFTCKEKFEDKYAKDKKYHKVRYHWHHTSEYRGYRKTFFTMDQTMIIVFVIKKPADEFHG